MKDSNFSDALSSATLMSMYDSMKDEQQANNQTRSAASNYVTPEIDPLQYMGKGIDYLSQIVDTIYHEGYVACGIDTEITGSKSVSTLICGLFYESISAINTTTGIKKAIYDYAINYAQIETNYTGEMMFSTDSNELKDILPQMTSTIISLIAIVTTRTKSPKGFDFAPALAEYMGFAESAILTAYPQISFVKRLPIITLEKFVQEFDRIMKKIEAENPGIENEPDTLKNQKRRDELNQLYNTARNAKETENFETAYYAYDKILSLNCNDWEAVFYVEYCRFKKSSGFMYHSEIESYCSSIVNASLKSLPLVKQQVIAKAELLIDVLDIAISVINVATECFVVAMNESKRGGSNVVKVQHVTSAIEMLFIVGDAIESSFRDNHDICQQAASACWKIAFEFYENCNMSAPFGAQEHYNKLLKYMPSYRCSKPLTGGSEKTSSGGCYIATCVYGSYDCPQVWTLRRFRDNTLAASTAGRMFINLYYAISPGIVRMFGNSHIFKGLCRNILNRIVSKLQSKGVSSSPYTD